MINKNEQRTSEAIKQQSPLHQLTHTPSRNDTTTKHRNSRLRFEQELEIASPKPRQHHSPPTLLSRLIEDDGPIEEQALGTNLIYTPQKDSVSSPRRSLIKQNQVWSLEQQSVVSPRRQLLYVSDEYYNEGVPLQTMNFLQRLSDILAREEESLNEKRRARLQNVIAAIRAEFERVREQLLLVVDDWCRRTEQSQVQTFLQRGEISANGQMVELTARLASRRQEIEQRMAELASGMGQSQLTPREEALRRNATVKKVVRQVWMRDYEYEVLQLQQEAIAVGNIEKGNILFANNGDIVQRELFQALHGVLSRFNSFKFVQKQQQNNPKPQVKTLSPPIKQKKEEESLLPASEYHREQVLQSLLEERRRQIDLESQMMLSQYHLRNRNE